MVVSTTPKKKASASGNFRPSNDHELVPMCRIRLVGSSVRLSGCVERVKKC